MRRHHLRIDLTQQGLADRVGVTRQTIISIENGKYSPPVGLALGLARELDLSVEELFELEGENNDETAFLRHPVQVTFESHRVGPS